MEVIVIILTLLSVYCDSIPVRPPEVIVVKCPGGTRQFPAILSHPTNCNQFFICNYLHPVLKSCPPGLVFDASVDVCNWPWAVDCERKDQARENTVVIVDTGGNEGVKINDTEDDDINVGDTDHQSEDEVQEPSSVIMDTDVNINEGIKVNDMDTVQFYDHQSEDEVQEPSSVIVDIDGNRNEGVKMNDTEDESINVGDTVLLYDREDEVQGLSSVIVVTDGNINEGVKMNDTEDESINFGDTVLLYDCEDEVQGPSSVIVDTDSNINEGVKMNDMEDEAINVGDTVLLYDHQSEDEVQVPSSVMVDTDYTVQLYDQQSEDEVQEPSSIVVDTDGNIIKGVNMNDTEDEAIIVGYTLQLYDSSDIEIVRDIGEHQNEDGAQGTTSVIVETDGNMNGRIKMNDKEDEAVNVGDYDNDNVQVYGSSEIVRDISEHQNVDGVEGTTSVIASIVQTDANMDGGIKMNDKGDEAGNVGDYDNDSVYLYDSSDVEILRDVSYHQSESTPVIVETNDNINSIIKINNKGDDNVQVYDSSEHQSEDKVQETTAVIVNLNAGITINDKEDETRKVGGFYDVEMLGSNIEHQKEKVHKYIIYRHHIRHHDKNVKNRGHREYKITSRTVNSEHLNEADHDENGEYKIINSNRVQDKEARYSGNKNHKNFITEAHRNKNNYANFISDDNKSIARHRFITENENDFKNEDINQHMHHSQHDNFKSNFKEYAPFDKNQWFQERWEKEKDHNIGNDDNKSIARHIFITENENDFKNEDIDQHMHHSQNDNFKSNFKEYAPFDKNRWFKERLEKDKEARNSGNKNHKSFSNDKNQWLKERWGNGLVYFKTNYWL